MFDALMARFQKSSFCFRHFNSFKLDFKLVINPRKTIPHLSFHLFNNGFCANENISMKVSLAKNNSLNNVDPQKAWSAYYAQRRKTSDVKKKNLIFNLRAHSRFVDAFIKTK